MTDLEQLVDKFIELRARKYFYNLAEGDYRNVDTIIDKYTEGANLLKPLLLEALEALEFVRKDCGGYEKEIDEGVTDGYIWEHVSGRAKTKARKTLTNIKGRLNG